MADLQKIVTDLSSLTVLEAAELAKLLEEKWGVSAAAAVAVARIALFWMNSRRPTFPSDELIYFSSSLKSI